MTIGYLSNFSFDDLAVLGYQLTCPSSLTLFEFDVVEDNALPNGATLLYSWARIPELN